MVFSGLSAKCWDSALYAISGTGWPHLKIVELLACVHQRTAMTCSEILQAYVLSS
jgi:hypothetical protein